MIVWEVISALILGFMIVGALWARDNERETWNRGICADNGLPWKQFDTDSGGGRGYKAGDVYCWISYNVDK